MSKKGRKGKIVAERLCWAHLTSFQRFSCSEKNHLPLPTCWRHGAQNAKMPHLQKTTKKTGNTPHSTQLPQHQRQNTPRKRRKLDNPNLRRLPRKNPPNILDQTTRMEKRKQQPSIHQKKSHLTGSQKPAPRASNHQKPREWQSNNTQN